MGDTNKRYSNILLDDVTATPEKDKSLTSTESAIEALKKLANSDFAIEHSSTAKYINDTLGVDSDADKSLEACIKNYHKLQSSLITEYRNAANLRTQKMDNCFFVLNGWQNEVPQDATAKLANLLLNSSHKKTSGGYYLCWNGTGVVINPGPHFLTHFHQQGFHIHNIDCVIVTGDSPEYYQDIQGIYNLNYQLNTHQAGEDLHIIQYYLNQRAHRHLASCLKPNFKQERNSVRCLELFIDSPEVEKIDLAQDVTLYYFQGNITNETKRTIDQSNSCLAIKLELKGSDNRTLTSLGYVSGTAWSPLLAPSLGRCDLLVTGFENTRPSDYGKIQYNEDCLGYFGNYSLLEEVAPRILLCCEYNAKNGDIRLEVAKKMRQEYAYNHHQGSSVIIGDVGLVIDLKALQVRCSFTHKLTDPSLIRLIRSQDAFGQLQYLSPSCVC